MCACEWPGEAVRSVGYGPPADVYPIGVDCKVLGGEGCDDIEDSYVTWLLPFGECAGIPGRPLASIVCVVTTVNYVVEHDAVGSRSTKDAAEPDKVIRLAEVVDRLRGIPVEQGVVTNCRSGTSLVRSWSLQQFRSLQSPASNVRVERSSRRQGRMWERSTWTKYRDQRCRDTLLAPMCEQVQAATSARNWMG
jgi:hypothetical protein